MPFSTLTPEEKEDILRFFDKGISDRENLKSQIVSGVSSVLGHFTALRETIAQAEQYLADGVPDSDSRKVNWIQAMKDFHNSERGIIQSALDANPNFSA